MKKGFTLVELLAVIVILAVIALIATPMILNVIETAKIGSKKASSYGVIDAIEYYNELSKIDGFSSTPYTDDLTFVDGVATCKLENNVWNTECTSYMDQASKKIKGEFPTGAEILISSTGQVLENTKLIFMEYTCVYDGKEVDCSKGEYVKPTPTAKNITYTNSNNSEVHTVEDAINDLFSKINN